MASVFKTVLLSSLSLAASVKNTKEESRHCAIKSNTSWWNFFNLFGETCMGIDGDDELYEVPEAKEIVLKRDEYFDIAGGDKMAKPLSVSSTKLIQLEYQDTAETTSVSWHTFTTCNQVSLQTQHSVEDAVTTIQDKDIQTLEYTNICLKVRDVTLMQKDDGVVWDWGSKEKLNCPCLRFEFQAGLLLESGTSQTVWIPFAIDQDRITNLRIQLNDESSAGNGFGPASGPGYADEPKNVGQAPGPAPRKASPANVPKDASDSASTSA